MKLNKFISIAIALAILSFSVMGLVHLPAKGIIKGFSLIKDVMPFPGKAVLVINKYIKFNPIELANQKKAENTQKKKNKSTGLLCFLLGSVLVCNEKIILILLIAIMAASYTMRKSLCCLYGGAYRPPDLKYYMQWRLKFITPIQKCIQTLAEKYTVNPILFNGRVSYTHVNHPHYVL